MAAPYRAYTIERVAVMLGVSVDLLEELAGTMDPEDGLLRLYDHTEHGRYAFNDFGIESAAEQLRDPGIVAYLQKLMRENA